MADEVTISNLPDSGSKQRVAYDLFNRIAHSERQDGAAKDRQYYFRLYAECLHVVGGGSPG